MYSECCRANYLGVRGIDLENYRALVAKYAWEAWRRLPPHTRGWVDVEFLIEDAFWFAYHYVLLGKRAQKITDEEGKVLKWRWKKKSYLEWQPNSGASFGTFLANQVQRYFQNYTDWLVSPRRHDRNTDSIQGMQEQYGEGVEFERVLGLPAYCHDPISACHVCNAFPVMYRKSSPKLKKRIMEWFVKDEPPVKLQVDAQAFQRIKVEFRSLAHMYKLTIDDCRHLYKSPDCMDKISRAIIGVPFDIDNPTPGLNRKMWLQG